MTPQDHLDRAEQLLDLAGDTTPPGYEATDLAIAVNALVHVTIAIAAELGAPHATAAAATPASG